MPRKDLQARASLQVSRPTIPTSPVLVATSSKSLSPLRSLAVSSSAVSRQAVRLAAKTLWAETSFLLTNCDDVLTITSGEGVYEESLPVAARLVAERDAAVRSRIFRPVVVHAVADGSLLATVSIEKNGNLLGFLGIHRQGAAGLNTSQEYVLEAIASELADQLDAMRISEAESSEIAPIDLIARLRLLESVVVNATDSILITEAEPIDKPGPIILYANPSFTRMTGYSLDEVIGMSPRILQGPLSGTEGPSRIRAALKAWEPIVVELLNYRKDGTTFWVELSISPVCNSAGWFTHWVSVQRDVTERKAMEALPEFLASPIEILLMAAEIPEISDYLTQSLGHGYKIATMENCADIAIALEASLPDILMLDVVLPHAETSEFLRKLRMDPKTALLPVILISSSLTEESRQRGMVAGVNEYLVKPFSPRELKTRLCLQLELQTLRRDVADKQVTIRAAEALRQSEKLAVVGRLASSIAHEINNPLEAMTNLLSG